MLKDSFKHLRQAPVLEITVPWLRVSPPARWKFRETSKDKRRVYCASSAAACPLITEGWPLWATLTGCAAVSQVASKTKIGQAISAPLLSMSLGVGLTALGVLPNDCASFDVVWQYIMPLAAGLYMLETDLVQLAETGGPVLVAFLAGAVTMVIGAVAAVKLVGPLMGEQGPKVAACLCASYVGGAVNFASVAKAISLPASVIPMAMAADNLAMAVFLALLSVCPYRGKSSSSPSKPPETEHSNQSAQVIQQSSEPPASMSANVSGVTVAKPEVTAESIAMSVGAAGVAVAVGKWMSQHLNMPALSLMFMAFVAAVFGTIGKAVHRQSSQASVSTTSGSTLAMSAPSSSNMFAGCVQMGTALMTLFFVIIGCSAGSLSDLAKLECLGMFAFLFVMVFIHWVLLYIVNRVGLKLPMPAVILGSNANVGGPATAAAMAAAKGWSHLVQPAMLSGTLGYAIGTVAGLMVARMS